jgi:micrococcal nuclease
MKNFLIRNKIIIAILLGAVMLAGAIYFSGEKNKAIFNKEIEQVAPEISGKNDNRELLPTTGACQNIPELKDGALKLVTKIIDGDTFLIEGGYSVRILGIDADERDHPCYEAAKNRLEELILNKEVKLEKGTADKDQWCRYLRYVFLNDKNIGLALVKEGLAVARFSTEDIKYQKEIAGAEEWAKENKIGCKWLPENLITASEKTSNLQWEKLTSELTGLKVISACEAKNYYGKEMIIEGKIANTYRSKTNTVFLNFEKSYPNHCFTAVIFKSDQVNFSSAPEKYYANKVVRLRGEIKEYQGKPEIILKTPSQIEVGK